jgi:hypothetical protein
MKGKVSQSHWHGGYSSFVSTITEFSEGLAGVTRDGKFGFIDKSGAYVIAPEFRKGARFRNGVAEVCDSRVCGYVDKQGRLIWPKNGLNLP